MEERRRSGAEGQQISSPGRRERRRRRGVHCGATQARRSKAGFPSRRRRPLRLPAKFQIGRSTNFQPWPARATEKARRSLRRDAGPPFKGWISISASTAIAPSGEVSDRKVNKFPALAGASDGEGEAFIAARRRPAVQRLDFHLGVDGHCAFRRSFSQVEVDGDGFSLRKEGVDLLFEERAVFHSL